MKYLSFSEIDNKLYHMLYFIENCHKNTMIKEVINNIEYISFNIDLLHTLEKEVLIEYIELIKQYNTMFNVDNSLHGASNNIYKIKSYLKFRYPEIKHITTKQFDKINTVIAKIQSLLNDLDIEDNN